MVLGFAIRFVVSFVLTQVIGMFYYAPRVLGTIWANALGLTGDRMKEAQKHAAWTFSWATIGAVVLCLLWGTVLTYATVGSRLGAVEISLLAGFVCSAAGLSHYMFSQAGLKVWLIDLVHTILTFAAIGAVFYTQ
ncbi:hypothetical protein PAPYR_4325 [Paratrimastix pyriformis]|uniref:DUF1761 domain-containing protein n=1 Tax=Paratrimastix pyriformis TaxID=342808 RepID=A0ABQ8UK47_9EUKA|nr:hypothetical protein PAPYR_4325 [Paratrimastix pyriformis]